MGSTKVTSKNILEFFKESEKASMEIYVQDLGWIVLLRDEIENVTDNWFTSSKYLASTMKCLNDEGTVLELHNVYKVNSYFEDNVKNLKYNLAFDKIHIITKKIIAYL